MTTVLMGTRSAKLEIDEDFYMLFASEPGKKIFRVYDLPEKIFKKLVERQATDKRLKPVVLRESNIKAELDMIITRYSVPDEIKILKPVPGKKAKKKVEPAPIKNKSGSGKTK